MAEHPLVKIRTKVDRSAAYAARYVAKDIVAAGLAGKCQVELAYAIGVAKPVSVLVDTFGTGKVSDDKLEEAVNKVSDLRPTAIIRDLIFVSMSFHLLDQRYQQIMVFCLVEPCKLHQFIIFSPPTAILLHFLVKIINCLFFSTI